MSANETLRRRRPRMSAAIGAMLLLRTAALGAQWELQSVVQTGSLRVSDDCDVSVALGDGAVAFLVTDNLHRWWNASTYDSASMVCSYVQTPTGWQRMAPITLPGGTPEPGTRSTPCVSDRPRLRRKYHVCSDIGSTATGHAGGRGYGAGSAGSPQAFASPQRSRP